MLRWVSICRYAATQPATATQPAGVIPLSKYFGYCVQDMAGFDTDFDTLRYSTSNGYSTSEGYSN